MKNLHQTVVRIGSPSLGFDTADSILVFDDVASVMDLVVLI